jgi:hypothetical protein
MLGAGASGTHWTFLPYQELVYMFHEAEEH